jgi:hypothetical protein
MSTRTRGTDGNSASSALRIEAVIARERAARVRAWASGVHQDDLRADLIGYAVQLEEKANGFERQADGLETSQ